jgi:hypothetical protein
MAHKSRDAGSASLRLRAFRLRKNTKHISATQKTVGTLYTRLSGHPILGHVYYFTFFITSLNPDTLRQRGKNNNELATQSIS